MDNRPPENNGEKLFALIAIILEALGAVALGLAFTRLGGYALIVCMVIEAVAMTFINIQQRKEKFKWLIYLKTAAYLLFAVAVILLVTGVVSM